jgi:hypothetical protein
VAADRLAAVMDIHSPSVTARLLDLVLGRGYIVLTLFPPWFCVFLSPCRDFKDGNSADRRSP